MKIRAGFAIAVALALGSGCVLRNPEYGVDEGVLGGSTGDAPSTTSSGSTTGASASAGSSSSSSDGSASASEGGSSTTGASASASGGDTSTSAADTSTSTTTGEPACGDGVVDPDEECDDGNLEGGDACSPLCHVPPVGIGYTGLGWSMPAGMDGGVEYSAACGVAAVGALGGQLDASMAQLRPCKPTLGCVTPTIGPGLAVHTPLAKTLGPYGTCVSPGMQWARPCAEGAVLVGLAGQITGGVVSQLRPHCALLTITEDADGFALELGAPVELDAIGGDGGTPFPAIQCPDGIATAVDLSVDKWIYKASLVCEKPILLFE